MKITLKDEFIKLGQALKAAGLRSRGKRSDPGRKGPGQWRG